MAAATRLFLAGKPQQGIDAIANAAPLARLGQPDGIARAVAFLVGPDGGWIKGQAIRANGGLIQAHPSEHFRSGGYPGAS